MKIALTNQQADHKEEVANAKTVRTTRQKSNQNYQKFKGETVHHGERSKFRFRNNQNT